MNVELLNQRGELIRDVLKCLWVRTRCYREILVYNLRVRSVRSRMR